MDLQLISGMNMCQFCYKQQSDAMSKAAAQVVVDAHVVDSVTLTKADVFITKNISLVELRNAIDANSEIPADQKSYAYTKECQARMQSLQRAIFEQEQAITKMRDEAKMYQIEVQNLVVTLRKEWRSEFTSHDITYTPKSPKSPKPKATPTPNKSGYKKGEVKQAAEKYGVASEGIRTMMIAKNMTADEAGKYLADLIKGGKK